MAQTAASAAWIRRETDVGTLRRLSLWMLAAGIALVLLLHMVPPTSRLDVLHDLISRYALTSLAPVFTVGVTLIAAGSAAALALFVRAGQCRLLSVPGIGIALWTVGMLGVALFPTAEFSSSPTATGKLHSLSASIAFVSLAVAIIALVVGDRRQSRLTRAVPQRRLSRRGGAAAVVCAVAVIVAVLVFAVYVAVSTLQGVRWWETLPLGLLERLVVAVELTGLIALVATTRPLA